MKFKFITDEPTSNLPEGFYYVDQDNYYIANLNEPNKSRPEKYLYSDSATSCIIVIVEGKDKSNNPIVALSHLSRRERFLKFFEIVAETFSGAAFVFAQGANPPSAQASQENTVTLLDWVAENRKGQHASSSWFIEQVTFSLGLGNPQIDDRGCYGIDLNTMIVSNKRYILTGAERDPVHGLQTLFCVFGLKVNPQIVLPKAGEPFTPVQIDRLVQKANSENWTDILNMTKEEVLNKYSSTPEYEAPWFFSELRESALYVKNYLNNN